MTLYWREAMHSSSPQTGQSIALAALIGLSMMLVAGSLVLADDGFVPDWQPRTNGVYAVRQVITGTGPDLDLFDLRTGESSTIAATEAHEGPADIDGDWVVWIENSFPWSPVDCTNRIMAKGIGSNDTITLAEDLLGPTAPRVSGNLVVWGSLLGSCPTESEPATFLNLSSLTIYDLNEMAIVERTGSFPGNIISVAIDGANIIWTQRSDLQRLASGDIFHVQIGADAPPVELGRAVEGSYDVSGDTVVYVDGRNQLKVVDLASGESNVLDQATAGEDLRSPPKARYATTDGEYVVWEQVTNDGGWQLRAYSLEPDEHYVLEDSEWPHQPHLRDGTLVWQSGDDRSGFGIRSASVNEFERLHHTQTGSDWREMLLWGGVAIFLVLLAAFAFRRFRQRPNSRPAVASSEWSD